MSKIHEPYFTVKQPVYMTVTAKCDAGLQNLKKMVGDKAQKPVLRKK